MSGVKVKLRAIEDHRLDDGPQNTNNNNGPQNTNIEIIMVTK